MTGMTGFARTRQTSGRLGVAIVLGVSLIVSCKKKAPSEEPHGMKKGRPVAEACPKERAVVPDPPPGSQGSCRTHADCTNGPNGRCFAGRKGAQCSYDSCTNDSECGSQGVCYCRPSAASAQANRCVTGGNCRTDADCKGRACSPSLGSCGHYSGVTGYYCHVPSDECSSDDDCQGKDGACRFVPEIGHFKCNSSECAG